MQIVETELTVYVQHTIDVLRNCGVNVEPLLANAGILREEALGEVEVLSAEKYSVLLDQAIALNIPGFGLMDGDNLSLLS